MPDYARVATFDMDDEALDALLSRIKADSRPPEGVPAKRLTILADRSAGRVIVATRFGSEDDLRQGAAVLDAMSPPDDGTRSRVSVDSYEVVFEQDTP